MNFTAWELESQRIIYFSVWYISAPVYFYVLLGDYDLLPTFSDHGGVSLNAHNSSY